MSRLTVGALFAAFTVSGVMQAITSAGHALAEPAARTVLLAACWLLKLMIVSAWAYFVIVRPPARRRAREPVAFLACFAAVLGAVALGAPEPSGSTALLLAGDSIALLSAGWLLYSVLALGTCFGLLPEARGLVTSGPYRHVRHPVYLGEFGMAAGMLLAALSLRNAVAVAMMVAGQVVRMRLEERALEREFPEYGAYAASTPRLIPLLSQLMKAGDPNPATAIPRRIGGGPSDDGRHDAAFPLDDRLGSSRIIAPRSA
jgi:protein-S-isoprenylcysteine O-methyltransferase Ste14